MTVAHYPPATSKWNPIEHRLFCVVSKNWAGRPLDSYETILKYRDELEASLDRLHTFIVKYVRLLCETRGISVDRDKPLHSLFGEYVKHLKQGGHLESEMTARILKSSISTLEAFNDVRNNRSLAHDNPILGYEEALLIFNHVAASARFLRSIHMATQEREHAATADAASR